MFVLHKNAPIQPVAQALDRRIMAYTQALMLVEMTMGKGAVGAMHTHPHHQVDYVSEGAVDFTLGNETVRMGKGDSVYIPPNVPHGAVALEEHTILLDIFSPMRDEFIACEKQLLDSE